MATNVGVIDGGNAPPEPLSETPFGIIKINRLIENKRPLLDRKRHTISKSSRKLIEARTFRHMSQYTP